MRHLTTAKWTTCLVLASLVLSACSGAQPPAPKASEAPTTAPAKPAAPAAPAASPAAPAAAAASPAAAAPAASPAAASNAAPAGGKPPTEVSIALISNVNYSAFWIGVEKGIFLKHGIDLKIKTLATAPEVIKAVQAGDVQLSVASWSGFAPARYQGIDLKIWSLLVNDPSDVNYDRYNAILVRPGLNANSVADLKGLKWGLSLGSGTDTYARAQLAKVGLKADDVQLMQVAAPNQAAAIASANIDVTATSEPIGVLIERTIPGSKVIVRGGNVYDGRITAVALAPWLDKNKDLAEQLWAATAESQQFARQNPDATAQAVSRALPGLEVPILREALSYLDFDPRYNTNATKAFQADNRMLIEQKKMAGDVKVEEAVAIEFIQAMQKKYPQYLNDLKPMPE